LEGTREGEEGGKGLRIGEGSAKKKGGWWILGKKRVCNPRSSDQGEGRGGTDSSFITKRGKGTGALRK